ncbi:MAG: DinB family protein [Alicyclobacillus shizuokensis]|nr:DinB family protein [Alicyclobacillus shizuokensis]
MNRELYAWVQESRRVLFNSCHSLRDGEFSRPVDGFGWGSIRSTLVHVADCYRAWLGAFALGSLAHPFASDEELDSMDVGDVASRFAGVDDVVVEFLDEFDADALRPIRRTIPWRAPAVLEVSPQQLFMHTITHEFHHKGQIVSMMRQMGHVPPDTDLLCGVKSENPRP